MRINSVSSFAQNNAVLNTAKQKNTNHYQTNLLNNSSAVNFKGSSLKLRRLVAGAMATIGVMLAIGPTAKAAAKQDIPAAKDSIVEPTPMPTYIYDDIEYPLPHPTIDNGITSSSGFKSMPLPYDELPEYMKEVDRELSEMDGFTTPPGSDKVSPWNMDFDEYLDSILPEANVIEDGDDLIIVQLKHEANAKVLASEAAKFLQLADDYAAAEYYELSDRIVEFANKLTQASEDAAASAKEASDTVEAIRQGITGKVEELPAPVPTAAPPIVYPSIDFAEDIFGYDKYFAQQYAELIPDDSNLSESEINEILTQRAEELREEAQENTDKAAELEEELKGKWYAPNADYSALQSDTMQIASLRKRAERANILANFFEAVAAGEKSVPVINPVPKPTPAPPESEPIACTFEDIFGYSESELGK